MARDDQPQRETLAFINSNKARVIKELDALICEWQAWQKQVEMISDHPYDPQTQSEVYADGVDNLKKHRILQEKTLVFLDNNISGHGFICGRDGTRIDRLDLRLHFRVAHRVDALDELRACLQYANVPDAYWKIKAKEMLDKVIGMAPDLAVETAAKYLEGQA